MNADDLVADLVGRFGKPDPAGWRDHYTPERATELVAELGDLEDQLDLGWPEWRQRKPFGHLGHEKIGWIKVRLLRRQLILEGLGDWGVRLDARPRDQLPMAIPVRPSRHATDRAAYRPILTTPLLAQRLAMPLTQVEELLSRLPDGVRDVRSWLVGERARLAAAPLPADSAPLPDLPPSTPGGGAA